MTEQNPYLITKLRRREDGRVDLWPKGMQHPEVILFDISDLQEANIDWQHIEPGIEQPCRFWAHWEYSDKTKSTGTRYKDVTHLEPINPQAATSLDTTGIIDRLDAVVGTLGEIQTLLTALILDLRDILSGSPAGAFGCPQESQTRQLTTEEEVSPDTSNDIEQTSTPAPETSDEPFTSPEAAITWGLRQGPFNSSRHALNAYKKIKADESPATAREMARLWRQDVARRLDAAANGIQGIGAGRPNPNDHADIDH